MSSLPSLSLFGCCNRFGFGSAAAIGRNGARLLQSGSAATLLDVPPKIAVADAIADA